MKVKLLIAVMALLMLFVGSASATDYYVNNTCTSGCDGLTPETGWQTIQQCADNVTAGDTCIVINTGTPYVGQTVISTSGNSTHRISFIGQNYPRIDCVNGSYPAPDECIVLTNKVDYITIEGFDIYANRTGIYTAVTTGNTDWLIIRNNIINTTGDPVPNSGHGISLTTNNSIIDNNTIITCRKGITIQDTVDQYNDTIINNWVWGGYGLTSGDGSSDAIQAGREDPFELSSGSYGHNVSFNTIVGAAHNGIGVHANNSTVMGNIVDNSTQPGARVFHNCFDFHHIRNSTAVGNIARNTCDENSGYFVVGVEYPIQDFLLLDNMAYNITGGRGFTVQDTLNTYIRNCTAYDVDRGMAIYTTWDSPGKAPFPTENLTIEDCNLVGGSGSAITISGGILDPMAIINCTLSGSSQEIFIDNFYTEPNMTVKLINLNNPRIRWSYDVKAGNITFYYYLDVYVKDELGNPIEGANVFIKTNNSEFPAINRDIYPKNIYYTYTGVDGHTPLPSNRTWTIAIPDYWRYRDNYTYFNNLVTVGTDLLKNTTNRIYPNGAKQYFASQVINYAVVNPDESWYRLNPDTYQNTTTLTYNQSFVSANKISNLTIMPSLDWVNLSINSYDEGISGNITITPNTTAENVSIAWCGLNPVKTYKLQRSYDNKYWNGSDWVSSAAITPNASGCINAWSDKWASPVTFTVTLEEMSSCSQDICVNTTGWWRNNATFNTSSTPIQSAIDNATSGDTILVEQGTYTENVDITTNIHGIYGNGTMDSVVIQADDTSDDVIDIMVSDVILSNLTVTGSSMLYGVYSNSHDNITLNYINSSINEFGIQLESCTNSTISNVYTDNSGYDIIIISYSQSFDTNITITNSTITGDGTVDGIRLDNVDNVTVTYNTIHSCDNGIYVIAGANNTVTGNSIYDSSRGLHIESLEGGNTFQSNTFGSGNYATVVDIVRLTDGTEAWLSGVTSPPASPSKFHYINKFIDVKDVTPPNESVEINISYSDSDLAGLQENTLRLLLYNTSWYPYGWFSNTWHDTTNNIIGVRITNSSSIIAPVAVHENACFVYANGTATSVCTHSVYPSIVLSGESDWCYVNVTTESSTNVVFNYTSNNASMVASITVCGLDASSGYNVTRWNSSGMISQKIIESNSTGCLVYNLTYAWDEYTKAVKESNYTWYMVFGLFGVSVVGGAYYWYRRWRKV